MTATGTASDGLWDRLGTLLGTLPAGPFPSERADAAVLVLARPSAGQLEVLAEERARRDGDPWSGQVGLPGGRKEPRDPSLTDTVLRELHEEVGLGPDAIAGPPRIFGVRSARPAGLRVAVFLGRLAGPSNPSEALDGAEVAGTFWLPLDRLRHPETRPRQTALGEMPVETIEHEGHVIWGFTLRVLRDVDRWLTDGTLDVSVDGPSPPGRSHAL